MVGMAGGQHRVWGGVLPDPGGRGRHAAGAVRLCQCVLGHSGYRVDHFYGGYADQHLRRALRRGHGFAHPWRGFWLHRLHHHVADLCVVHLHLLCVGGRRHGLCAGPGAGYTTALGLPDLCAGGDSAGDPRRVGHQPFADVDTAAVAADAGGPVCVCADARSWCVFRCCALWWGFWSRRQLQFALFWCGTHGRYRTHHPNGGTGRLFALHASADAAQPLALVAGCAGRGAGLGGAGGSENAGWRAAGLPGHHPHGANRARGGPEPDVPGGL